MKAEIIKNYAFHVLKREREILQKEYNRIFETTLSSYDEECYRARVQIEECIENISLTLDLIAENK